MSVSAAAPVFPFTDRAEFDAAVDRARKAAAAYYDTGDMLMVDADYDALAERIAATRATNPGWDDQGVTTMVAAGASAGGDVRHPEPMLSLDKAKTMTEVEAFVARLGDDAVVVEVKLDGVAIRAEYREGQLTVAASRGDGVTGENLTGQVRSGVAGLPARLPTAWTGEVRGEIFMTDSDFETASTNRVAAGGRAFVNARNATAGSLRNTDRKYETPMSFAAYDITGELVDGLDGHAARMAMAATLGFTTAWSLLPTDAQKLCHGAAEVISAIDAIGARRAGLDFPIDGAVVKADSTVARLRLGHASRTPYWATAFKYPADTAFSVLRDIEVRVGRTGRASFRGLIDPVFVGGTTVTYASLHNAPWILNAGLGIGMRVAVVRAGDVIPRVTAAVGEQPDDVLPWQPPTACPQCGEPWDTSSLLWRCHTPSCAAANALVYWCSRDAMDVDRVGESICDALVDHGLASTVADLYDLAIEQWAALPLGGTASGGTRFLGVANATEIFAGLQRSKTQPLNRVITGLGIRMTGRSVGRWLAARFKTMTALRTATVEDIASIERLGTIKAEHIVAGLTRMAPVIDRLAAHGITMQVTDQGGDKPLDGKTYVVSGTVPGYTRTTVSERIEALGGRASSSVSANTTALVTSETTTSKAKKAAQLGVPVIDPTTFADLLG